MTGALLALAYPDRIGRRRPGTAGRYLLSGGRGAALPEGDPMANEEFVVVADLDGSTQDSRIFLAAPITLAEIEDLYARAHRRATRRCDGASARAPCWRDGSDGWGRWSSKTSRSPNPMPRSSGRRWSTACASSGFQPCHGATISPDGAIAWPSCAGSTKAGPTCRTRPCSPRSRAGWRRSSTRSRGAITWRGSISTPR